MKRIVVYLFLLCTVFQGTVFAGADDVLAKIGDKIITARDFDFFISAYPPEKQKFLAENPQARATLLIRMAQVITLADLARVKGLDKGEGIRMQIENSANEILAAEILNELSKKIEVTDDDIKLYYQKHEEEFRFPETVKVRHILVAVKRGATDNDRKAAREKAAGLLKRIKEGEDFGKLASEFSDDAASKSKGEDLGFFPRGRMPQPFEDVAFSLKPGELSDLIETPYGYYIIRLEEKKGAGLKTLAEVRDQIRDKVLEIMKKEKSQEFLDKALKERGVEVHTELITGQKK